MRHFIIALFALANLIFAASPLAAAPAIVERTLSNGMKIYILPNPATPAVSHTLWYRVGAADDPPGASGLAHVVEHMMFRGTDTIPPGEFSRRIAALGGRDNAFTTHDATAYFQSVAKEHLATIMAMEADRMQHLRIDPTDLKRELGVIREERRMRTEASVSGSANEQIDATLFLHHPYRLPTIGWAHEIDSITVEDLLQFRARYYQPGNAFLVVAGDITPDEATQLAETHYGAIPSQPAPTRSWNQEPPAASERRLTLRHPQTKQPLWWQSFQSPSYQTTPTPSTPYALQLLAYTLGADQTGILYQKLVTETGLATAVDVSYSPNAIGPARFDITVTPRAEADLPAIESTLHDTLHNLAITKDQLTLARDTYLAWRIYDQEGLSKLAFTLGHMLATGQTPADYAAFESRIEKLTPQELQTAAQRLFRPEASVTTTILPAEQP